MFYALVEETKQTFMDANEKDNKHSEQRQEDMEEIMFDLEFQFDGKDYKGWAKPSAKKDDDDMPSSYHIVLNGVFFGHLSVNLAFSLNSH
jgi:hypothetical protein